MLKTTADSLSSIHFFTYDYFARFNSCMSIFTIFPQHHSRYQKLKVLCRLKPILKLCLKNKKSRYRVRGACRIIITSATVFTLQHALNTTCFTVGFLGTSINGGKNRMKKSLYSFLFQDCWKLNRQYRITIVLSNNSR